MSAVTTQIAQPQSAPMLGSAKLKRIALENALQDRQARLDAAPSDFERNHLKLGISMVQVLLGNLAEPLTGTATGDEDRLVSLYADEA